MPSKDTSNCTLETCAISDSIYTYTPSLAANVTFLTLFAVSGIAHILQGWYTKKTAWTISITLGSISEVLGYVGRVISHHDPFNENGFLIQICCLTIAPAFFTAGIYFCLGDIVARLPIPTSRIKPKGYAAIFVPCDFVSLILQGAGGGLASTESQSGNDPKAGTNVMVAGLAFQVASMTLFIALAGEYAWKSVQWRRQEGKGAPLPFSKTRLQIFAAFFSLAIVCIYTRCVYRVAELSEGWNGHLIQDETFFIVLEGA